MQLVTASRLLRCVYRYEQSAVERRLPLRRTMPDADPPRLLAAASAATQKPPHQPHCTREVAALRAGLKSMLLRQKFKFDVFKIRVSVGRI